MLSLVIAGALSLGGYLYVRGRATSIPGPWLLFAHLPILRYAIAIRFAVFVALPAALIVAMWLSRPARGLAARARWALALLAIAVIVPEIGSSSWNTRISDPPFFQHSAYRAYLKASDHVLTVPVWGPNERWIADAGFPFALSAGYAGNPFPTSYSRYPTWATLVSGRLTPDYARQLRRFVEAKDVTAVVVDERAPGPWTTLFATLGVRPIDTGGVLLYRIAR